MGCKDRGVKAVWWQVWGLYSDYFGPARFSPDRQPNAEVQALLGRCELFLRTDLPYEWPALGFWGTFRLLRWIPLIGRVGKARRARFEAAGDTSAWPFLRREQLEQARLESRHDRSAEVDR